MKKLVGFVALFIVAFVSSYAGTAALRQTHKFTNSVVASSFNRDTTTTLSSGRNIFEIPGGTHDKSNVSGYVSISYDSLVGTVDTTGDSVYLLIFTAWEGDLTPKRLIWFDSAAPITGAASVLFFDLEDSLIGGEVFFHLITVNGDSLTARAGNTIFYSATAGLFARDHQ